MCLFVRGKIKKKLRKSLLVMISRDKIRIWGLQENIIIQVLSKFLKL